MLIINTVTQTATAYFYYIKKIPFFSFSSRRPTCFLAHVDMKVGKDMLALQYVTDNKEVVDPEECKLFLHVSP